MRHVQVKGAKCGRAKKVGTRVMLQNRHKNTTQHTTTTTNSVNKMPNKHHFLITAILGYL
jgi:hypothetical protein